MKRKTYLLFLLPSLLVITLTQLYPLSTGFYMSLTRWRIIDNTGRFIGLTNYLHILQNVDFWSAFLRTLVFSFVTIISQLIIGFILATLIDSYITKPGIINTAFLLPMITAPAVVGLLFKWLFNANFGLVTYLLSLFKLRGIVWLSHPILSLVAICIAEIWQFTPFVILIFYAGLQSIPVEPFEAAVIDGANKLQEIYYITIPMLKPIVTFVVVMRLMDTFRLFDKIYIMTGGGPGTATETFSLYNYRMAFRSLKMGEGSSIAVLTLVTLSVLIMWFLKAISRGEEQ